MLDERARWMDVSQHGPCHIRAFRVKKKRIVTKKTQQRTGSIPWRHHNVGVKNSRPNPRGMAPGGLTGRLGTSANPAAPWAAQVSNGDSSCANGVGGQLALGSRKAKPPKTHVIYCGAIHWDTGTAVTWKEALTYAV
jgi:hypothetical protein